VTAQEKRLGERIGKQLDKGLRELQEELREGWTEVRKRIDKLSVEGRVYSRLHWDKGLRAASFEIEVPEEGVVVLTGSVPSAAAQRKAVQLAEDTVGVRQVVDRLTVVPPSSAEP